MSAFSLLALRRAPYALRLLIGGIRY